MKKLNKYLTVALLAIINTGCVVFLSAVAAATIYYFSGDDAITIEAVLDKPAETVFAALIEEVNKVEGGEIKDKDDENLSFIATRGDRKAECVITKLDDKKCQLKVVADAGLDDKEKDMHLAMKIVTRVCNNLKIDYRIVEKDKSED